MAVCTDNTISIITYDANFLKCKLVKNNLVVIGVKRPIVLVPQVIKEMFKLEEVVFKKEKNTGDKFFAGSADKRYGETSPF